MQDDSKLEKEKKSWACLTARIFGSLVVAFWLLMGISYGFGDSKPITWESAVITALIIVTTAGFVIAWKREKIGGLVLIIAGVIHSVLAGLVSGDNHLFAVIITGGPYIIIGVLFLMSWRESKGQELSE